MTGLALESSDMDMAVTNLYLPDREKMIESLDLFAEECRLAQDSLNSITGEFTSDDLLGAIFSRFCIGK